MSIVVVLRGPAGVGKSTISDLIQAKLGVNWVVLNVDDLKKYMPLKDGQSNRAERAKIAQDVSKFFAKEMYTKGYDIILEEMYKKPYNDSLVEFLQQNEMRYLKVFLSAPEDVVVARSAAREKNPPEEEIRRHYAEIAPYENDFVIDTVEHSSQEAADLIIGEITKLEHAQRVSSVREALDAAVEFLETRRIPGARLDAELLLAHTLRRDRAWLLAHDDEALNHLQEADFEAYISRRSENVPVVHLTGRREFYGLDFAITPDVLTPRAETEQMVDWAIKYAPVDSRLVDIGTGSGAVATAIAVHRPDLVITATEVSAAALKVARANAKTHGASIEFIESDLWSAVDGRFATIVTNLPYLRDDADLMPEVQREPAVALFGGADGLDLYRRFLTKLPDHLAPGGYLFTECDPWQQTDLITEAGKYQLEPVEQGYFILGLQHR